MNLYFKTMLKTIAKCQITISKTKKIICHIYILLIRIVVNHIFYPQSHIIYLWRVTRNLSVTMVQNLNPIKGQKNRSIITNSSHKATMEVRFFSLPKTHLPLEVHPSSIRNHIQPSLPSKRTST